VYGYEYACEYTFSAAASLGLARYYELPIAHWATAQRLLKEEALRCPAWEPTLVGTRDSAQKHERRSRELALADWSSAQASLWPILCRPTFGGKRTY